MITFKNELPMNHEKSIQHIVYRWAHELLIQEFKEPTDNKVYEESAMHIDHAKETSWNSIEEHLQSEGLKMECSNEV